MSPKSFLAAAPFFLVCAAVATPSGDASRVPASVPRSGFGDVLVDPAFRKSLAATKAGKAAIRRAADFLKKPFPETSDELFLDYSKTGNRDRWQKINNDRRSRLFAYALAEALENKGRFVKPYVAAANAILAEKLWVLPAHDPSLAYFKKGEIHIDLGSSELAWTLAECNRILETKLDPAFRDAVTAKVRERVLDPYVEMLSGKRKKDWWVDGTNNWNAVCHCGVVGAALASPIPDDLRATILKGAMTHVRKYIDGFPADGVSDEGLGYWGYGFGRYVDLAELTRLATGGACDPTAEPAFRTIASVPARMEIDAGVRPAFGDCAVDVRPDSSLCVWLADRLKLPAPAGEPSLRGVYSLLYAPMFAGAKTESPPVPLALRDWFPDSGILVVRPREDTKSPRLAAAFKGGDNAESHNHNDNGNFILTLDGARIVADPGNEIYTARTFSAKRYDSRLLSGFGHSVPVVDGVLQAPGKKAKAVVLDRTSSDASETLRYDLVSGYPVQGLEKLTRDFTYARGATPSLNLNDTFGASRPLIYGGALVTFGAVERTGVNRYRITEAGKSAVAEFSTKSGGALKFEIVEIDEKSPYPRHPYRLGYSTVTPATDEAIAVKITPDF